MTSPCCGTGLASGRPRCVFGQLTSLCGHDCMQLRLRRLDSSKLEAGLEANSWSLGGEDLERDSQDVVRVKSLCHGQVVVFTTKKKTNSRSGRKGQAISAGDTRSGSIEGQMTVYRKQSANSQMIMRGFQRGWVFDSMNFHMPARS